MTATTPPPPRETREERIARLVAEAPPVPPEALARLRLIFTAARRRMRQEGRAS